MANAKKCDRCGKLYDDKRTYPFPQIKIVDEFSANNQRAYLDLRDLDLCFDCNSSFFDWLKEHNSNDTKSPCCDCKVDKASCGGCPKYFEWEKQKG